MEVKDIFDGLSTLQVKDFVDLIGAIISLGGAIGSSVYYKKSRQLRLYTQTNSAFIEIKNIINELLEITKLSNKSFRGNRNTLIKRVGVSGINIKTSVNKIREDISVKDLKKINKLLNTDKINVDSYIQNIISGDIVQNEKVIIDDDFRKCEIAFNNVQQYIKDRLDSISEKLK